MGPPTDYLHQCLTVISPYLMVAVAHTHRYGFRGFHDPDMKPISLNRKMVDGIQLEGGTILGTTRGNA